MMVEDDLETCLRIARAGLAASILLSACLAEASDEMNYFEWAAVAPDLVLARILSTEGRSILAEVEISFKGDLEAGREFLIDIRTANRNRMSHRRKRKLLHGERYLMILESGPKGKKKRPVYRLARGVDGARELPAEGEEALVEALRTFVELHRAEGHEQLWSMHSRLLDSTNPIVLKTVLEQYVKFRMGEPGLYRALLPLTAHPSPAVRVASVTLIGQIIESDGRPETAPEVREEIIALARKDRSAEVRVAATVAVAMLGDDPALRILDRISSEDPDQLVRYTAQKLLLEAENGAR